MFSHYLEHVWNKSENKRINRIKFESLFKKYCHFIKVYFLGFCYTEYLGDIKLEITNNVENQLPKQLTKCMHAKCTNYLIKGKSPEIRKELGPWGYE